MIIKKSLKITLSALLLSAGISAYAAGTGPVTLKNGDKISWTDFVNAINNPETIEGGTISKEDQDAWDTAQSVYQGLVTAEDTAGSEYQTAKNNVDAWTSELTALNGAGKSRPKWLSDAYTQTENFYNAYTALLLDETYDKNTVPIWYTITKSGRTTLLLLSFSEVSGFTKLNGEFALYEEITSGSFDSYKTVYLYLGPEYTETTINAIQVTSNGITTENIAEVIFTKIESAYNNDKYDTSTTRKQELINSINEWSVTKQENGKTKVENLFQAWLDAQKDLKDGLKPYQDAETAYKKAEADAKKTATDNYMRITLTEDITTGDHIESYGGIITGGKTINGKTGQPCIITYTGGSELFETFTGSLVKIGINGNFAAVSSGQRNNAASWNGETGVFYNSDGTRFGTDEAPINSIGELGYRARAIFGIDFANGGKLVDLTDASKVYSITAYTSADDATHYFAQAQVDDNKFVHEDGTLKLEETNTLVKSADNLEMTNVFYLKDGNYVSNNIEITDKLSFYSPEEIVAKNLNYAREFKAGQNAVILPFALKASDNSNIDYICTYYKETTDKFWFQEVAEGISANTPFMLVTKPGVTVKLDALKNITIKPTDKSQIERRDSKLEGDNSRSVGTFKYAKASELTDPENAAYRIYLMSDGKFKLAALSTEEGGKNASIPAFRMVINSARELTQNSSPENLAPRRIGILNRFGEDITEEVETGLNGIHGETTGLNVIGGQGAITITAEADHGQVPVYSIDGKMVATANVEAGTTTVNVKGGIYIVLGHKVLVK